jgi:CDP-glycerol glycerophosphotransferase (TagB/SpsB family)
VLAWRALKLGPIGSARALARRSLWLARWRYVYYIAAYALWRRLRPVDANQVAFLSDSRAELAGNLADLRAEIARQSPQTRVVTLLRPRLDTTRSLRQALAWPRLIATSRVVVVEDFYPLVYQVNLRPGTALGQVWHAVGAFKRVGHSRAGLPGGPVPGSRIHRNYTWATASSEAVRPDVAEAFGIDLDRVHALGVPRTDVLFDPVRVAAARAAVQTRLGIQPDRRIVLFAPTFRGPGARTAHYDPDLVDWPGLVRALGPEFALVTKMHPFVRPLTQMRPDLSGVIDVTHEREMTELLMAADVLVTDYSSAIFEFALLRRPIVFLVPDLAEYAASRDFYRPFERYLIGSAVSDQAHLADAIRSARIDDAVLDPFLEEFASACDGHSAQRIVRRLILARSASATGDAGASPTLGGSNPRPAAPEGVAP